MWNIYKFVVIHGILIHFNVQLIFNLKFYTGVESINRVFGLISLVLDRKVFLVSKTVVYLNIDKDC